MTTTQFSKWRERRTSRPTFDPPTPVTVFVFSGGGLNGAAQVGMLQELFARGITPDGCVGVSAGALNALAVAANPTQFEENLIKAWQYAGVNGIFQKASNPKAMWAIVRQRGSLDPGYLLRAVIRNHLPIERLEDSVIPLRIGTVALSSGEMHWHSSGSAYDVLMASCAIPGILPPIKLNGQLHVDGSVCSPIPVAAAIELRPTRLVVLDVSLTQDESLTPLSDPSALTVLIRSFEAARRRVSAAEMASLTPDLEVIYLRAGRQGSLGAASPAYINKLIEEGRAAAKSVLDGLSPLPLDLTARPRATVRSVVSRLPKRPRVAAQNT
jgi:NTE family protein